MFDDVQELWNTPRSRIIDMARSRVSVGGENEPSVGENLPRDSASEEEKEPSVGENLPRDSASEEDHQRDEDAVLDLDIIDEEISHNGNESIGSQAGSQRFSRQDLGASDGVPDLRESDYYETMPPLSPNPTHHTRDRKEKRDERRDKKKGRDKFGNDLSDILGELEFSPPSRPKKRGETADQRSKFILTEGVPDEEVAR